jgi:4-hydroxy-tetrahydrodipicolinate reductase
VGDALALTLGAGLSEVARYERASKREPGTIGFSVTRAGDIVGEHTVLFASEGERLEVTHKASSRSAFATGALRAAHFIADKPVNSYTMADVLGLS